MRLLYGIALLIGVLASCSAGTASLSSQSDSYDLLMRSALKSASRSSQFVEQSCQTEALSQIDIINGWSIGNESLLKDLSQPICQSMVECSSIPDGDFSIFDCYSNAGINNTKKMYNLSVEAGKIGAQLRNQLRIVSVDQEDCEAKCERARTEEEYSTMLALQDCLQNGPPEIVTDDPTTDTTEAALITTSVLDTNEVVNFESSDKSSDLNDSNANNSKLAIKQILNRLKRSMGGS